MSTPHDAVKARAIRNDWRELRAAEFPLASRRSWFNTATYGPMPTSGIRAQTAFLNAMASGAPEPGMGHWWDGAQAIREKAAHLIGAQPEDVCFLSSTSAGIGLAALGLDWAPGDEVITYDLEFLSVVTPWLELQNRGVEVRFVRDRGRLRFDVEDIAALITDHTRVISLSLVNFSTGFRAPVEQIAALCRERGIWLIVDAVQAIGCLDVDVRTLGADIVTAHGYKALCAGYGVSICYVSPALRAALRMPVPGWKSLQEVEGLHDLSFEGVQDLTLAHDARRFEPGVPNLAGMYALEASIDLFVGLGKRAIEDHVLAVGEAVTDLVTSRGYTVASSMRAGERSSIVAFHPGSAGAEYIVNELAAHDVVCANREGRVRVAAHLFVDEADVDRLAAALPRS